jgi:hypothetical protein
MWFSTLTVSTRNKPAAQPPLCSQPFLSVRKPPCASLMGNALQVVILMLVCLPGLVHSPWVQWLIHSRLWLVPA